MSFLISPWFIFPVLGAGSWLAYELYFRSDGSPPSVWRWSLVILTLLAWIALAGLLVQPLWTLINFVYHPPAIVIAVDESPSYSGGRTLRAGGTVQGSVEEVQGFYQKRGFRILNYEFGETVRPMGSAEDVGILTSRNSLRRHLDSLAILNIQGVFVWTDGRWNFDTGASVNFWPAPVFPIIVQGALGEVQGERVKAEFSDPDSGAEVSVDWRSIGGSRSAQLELQSGSATFYRESLPNPNGESGVKLRHHFHLPAPALPGVGEKWIALIRPERRADNFTEKNDTVAVDIQGLHRKRQIFLRPLRSLEERGLMDVLFASDSMEVLTVAPESLDTALHSDDALWAHAQFAPQAVLWGRKTGAPVILYTLPGESAGRPSSAFTSGAHVTWRGDAERFLPGGVLTLADLGWGASGCELARPDSSLDAVAWAEESGRRGLLFARRKDAATPVFEFAVPPIWSSQFHPGADARIRRLQERWAQGVAEWIRLKSSPRQVSAPPPPVARPPMDLELSRLGVDVENLSALASASLGRVLRKPEDADSFIAALPDLPRGQTEERRSKASPLFPSTATTLTVIGLLCAAWALRKKLHLD